ncbi:uncharacterized protein J7T54_008489 [Emericellopsis cladophorae]|uniref:Uncharacterized protein n=1 Tax=Emericellopsis cladophorae TaxID=2686198 RepID=A0A9Q0BB55_9HYPO|nr:uncharacterized protein J7T54_008489 [Emericellopsis cladophorae]KAI6778311.1 hypothetical protein J7T54_008489 [Emericellopsis cladophorae]
MAPNTTASLAATQGRINELMVQIAQECPSWWGDLTKTREISDKLCFAMQRLEQRQQRRTRHLPSINWLFSKTEEIVAVFERTLLAHLSGENKSLIAWHANGREVAMAWAPCSRYTST